jgi:hypothetical protein
MADDCGLVGFVGAEDPEVPLDDRRRVLEMRQYVKETHQDIMGVWSTVSTLLASLLDMQLRSAGQIHQSPLQDTEWKHALKWALKACSRLDYITDTTLEVHDCRDHDDASWDDWLLCQGYEIDDPEEAPTEPTSPQTEEPLQ